MRKVERLVKKQDLTFGKLQQEVYKWSLKNFPKNQPVHPLLGAVEELGELAHAHLKADQGIRGTAKSHRAAKQDAVGDIIVYLADYCSRENFDLQHIVETVWGQVKSRNWAKNPKNGRITAENRG